MFYAAMFDFGLAALVFVASGFFVWCWVAFGKDRMRIPIYKQFGIVLATQTTADSAGKRRA